MKNRTHQTLLSWAAGAAVLGLGLLVSATPAAALTLGGIGTSTFDSISGGEFATLTSSYDFIPVVNGGDGQITSTVYTGIGDADGFFVYTYDIELYDIQSASIGAVVAVTFTFHATPVDINGIGDAFYIDDGSGGVAPSLAFYDATDATAGFVFVPLIGNGETSFKFGLISPNAPAEALAQLYDSGATGGQAVVLSNGVSSLPEPSAALVFALGFAAIARRCSTRR
jgi:hypothetical protein